MSTNLQQTLTNPEYRNWVKSGLALKCTKDGIQHFVDAEVNTFQKNTLASIWQASSISPGTICTSCTTENVLPCPTVGICSKRCRYHDNNDPTKKPGRCPNGICSKFCDKIKKKHRYKGPSWHNTNAQHWGSNSWEVAKCFMASGYSNVLSAADTDILGLLSVVINLTDFQNTVTANLSNPNNIFCKARTVRNEIFHSPTFQMTDTVLDGYIDIMMQLLNDSKYLAADKNAQDAITKLTEIRNGTLVVTDADERKLRKEAEQAQHLIQTEGTEQIGKVEKCGQEQIEEVEKCGHEQTEEVERRGQDQKEEVEKCGQEQKEEVKKCGREQKEKVEKKGTEKLEQLEKTITYQAAQLERKKEDAIKAISERQAKALKAKEDYAKEEELKYSNQKRDITNILVQQYKDDMLSTPLYPLLRDEEVDIADIYVTPCMQDDNQKLANTDNANKGTAIESYRDIFYRNSTQCKKIYITGDGGIGKTVFCQKMVSTWCTAHSNKPTGQNYQPSKDEEEMLEFQFLFYISLRHAGSDTNIEEMIKHQVLHDPEYQYLLRTILHKEKCLIILDGLDEWQMPACSNRMSPEVNKGLPDRQKMSKCTIMTTTRPCKLEILRLRTSEIDQQIKLTGLGEKSSRDLIDLVLKILNSKNNSNNSTKDFEDELHNKKLEQFRAIPLLLKRLVCLWYEEKNLPKAQSAIYSGMLNVLIELAKPRLVDNHELEKMKEAWKSSQIILPSCFKENPTCQEFKPMLLSLGRLAFETLLSETQEQSLVFEHSKSDLHGLTETEIDICLKIGILSQSKILKGCTRRMKSLSFLHKTFQEYLAALFIATKPLEETQEKLRTCNSISQIFAMLEIMFFASGMNPAIASKLSIHITKALSKDEGTQLYRQTFSIHSALSLKLYQDKILESMQECIDSGNENAIFQIEDIFIFDSSPNLHSLINTNINNVKSIYIHSIVPNELKTLLLQVDKLQTLALTDNKYISTPYFYKLLMNSKNTLLSINVKGHFANRMKHIIAHNIKHMILPTLVPRDIPIKCINTIIANMSEPMNVHEFSFMFHQMPNVTTAEISNIAMSPKQQEGLMLFLSRATQMRRIKMENVFSLGRVNYGYQLDLSNLANLEYLHLAMVNLKDVQVNTTVLQTCKIFLLHPGVMASVLESLHRSPKLQHLQLGDWFNQYPSDALDKLVSSMSTLSNLKKITLTNIDFGEKELKLAPELRNLEKVRVAHVTMTSTAFCNFVETLSNTQNHVEVQILSCRITPAEQLSTVLEKMINNPRVCASTLSKTYVLPQSINEYSQIKFQMEM